MTARGGGVLNLRRWPRSAVQLRPTVIDIGDRTRAVLTTAGVRAHGAVGHSSTTTSRTFAGAHPHAAVTKAMSFAVYVPAAVYVTAAGVAPLNRNINVLTGAAVGVGIGLGVAVLLDENGDPILDEFGFPILIYVQGSTKTSNNAALLTGAMFVASATIESTNIATAVLTTFGGLAAAVSTTSRDVSALTTVIASLGNQIIHSSTTQAATTAAANHVTAATHNVPTTAAETTGAAFAGIGAVHSAPTASQTHGAAHSGSGVGHDSTVAVRTTVGVITITLLEAINSISVTVLTSAALAAQSATLRAALPTVSVSGGALTVTGPLERDTAIAVTTSAGVDHTATELQHDVVIEDTPVTIGVDAASETGHDIPVDFATITYAAVSADVVALHEALIEEISTTVGVHTQWSELLVQLCVELSAIADSVTMTVEADTVCIDIEEC